VSSSPKASRRSRGTVTIEDVARAAGVSAMTVSRVINKEPNVRDETRRNVLGTIARMNYSPNTAARSLAAGEATHIGLLYTNPSAAYLSQFLVGALDAARAAGCHLVIEACESGSEDEQREVARRFSQADAEGVILPPPLSESVPILKELEASGTPVVTVAMGKLYPNALNVRIDDFAAAKEITNHLIGLGHRQIGLIKGHPAQIASIERERGFLAAVNEAGLRRSDVPIVQGYFTFRSGLEAAEKLLRRKNRPTAIFASNDDMAAAVVSVAHRQGLDVPTDLSVVGFDDTAPATTVWPELTTIRQPVAAMAGAALNLLLADLRMRNRGRSGNEEVILDHKLIVRQSSGPAPAASGT
jgi:LacI family transcriptional regulator